jgi:peptidoglycan/LPS O-acetylase OafA/YrhL
MTASAESGGRNPDVLPGDVRPEKVKTSDPREHYVELDALRGIAILGALLTHLATVWTTSLNVPLTIPLLREDALRLLHSTGLGAFSLFFLLSGYLLIWTEEKRARLGTYSVRSYALRRMLRLVPAYYFAMLVVIVVWAKDVSITDVLMHISFLHALNPHTAMSLDPVFWSLTTEAVCYVLLPFLVLKLTRLSQRLALFVVLFFVALVTQITSHLIAAQQLTQPDGLNLPRYLHFLPTNWLYLFLAGVLLRMLVEHLGTRPTPRLQPPLASVLFLASVVFLLTFPFLVEELPMRMPLDLIVIAFFASVLLGAPLLREVLRWRPLVFVGVISYSLFLLHHTVIVVVFRPLIDDVREWIVGRGDLMAWAAFSVYLLGVLPAAVAVSYLSYRYIESPFLRRKPK